MFYKVATGLWPFVSGKFGACLIVVTWNRKSCLLMSCLLLILVLLDRLLL